MDVSEDVLGLVLERVDSHVSLIRAAAVCKRWRRAITDAAFLRRFRALHAPPITGYCHPTVFVPSSPSIVDARHFSLDFLPNGAESWVVVDSRGSLLLVKDLSGRMNHLADKAVCEPLTRRYMRIRPPADLDKRCYFLGGCLIDGEADDSGGRISMSNFRVVCLLNRNGVMHAAVYTAGSSWSKKNIGYMGPNFNGLVLKESREGEMCWHLDPGRALITLDRSTGDFSSSELPPLEDLESDSARWDFNFGRDGKLRIFIVFNDAMKVFVRCEVGKWALEKRIMLPEATRGLPGYEPSFFSGRQVILRSGAGFVVLSPLIGGLWRFSVNLETMEVAPGAEFCTSMVYGCELPWPPTLHACLDG